MNVGNPASPDYVYSPVCEHCLLIVEDPSNGTVIYAIPYYEITDEQWTFLDELKSKDFKTKKEFCNQWNLYKVPDNYDVAIYNFIRFRYVEL